MRGDGRVRADAATRRHVGLNWAAARAVNNNSQSREILRLTYFPYIHVLVPKLYTLNPK